MIRRTVDDIEELTRLTEDGISHLNVDQRTAFEKIIAAVEAKTSVTFFVDEKHFYISIYLYFFFQI